MHPLELRMTTMDGYSIAARYYAGVSTGPSYLLGHGFTGRASQPRVVRIAEHLNTLGADVLALDFRGHGDSEGLSSVGVTETADVAAGVAWLAANRPGVPIITLGFSMGASIVIRHAGLAGTDAGVTAVVAVSGPGRWFERGTVPMRRVNRGLETRLGRAVLRRVLRTRIGGGWDELPLTPVETAAGITVPTLIVHGDSDPYFGLEHARMLSSAVPDAQLWIEAGMGHAENATTDELVDRIDGWARAAIAGGATAARGTAPNVEPSATMAP